MNNDQFRTLVTSLFYINKLNKHGSFLAPVQLFESAKREADDFLALAPKLPEAPQPPPLPQTKGGPR